MSDTPKRKARIHYARVDEFWRKEEKYAYLDEKQHRGNVEWQEIQPDAKHNWLTKGMQEDFEEFLQIANKTGKAESKTTSKVIYSLFGRGVSTSRDAWAYNFSKEALRASMAKTIEAYNGEVARWSQKQSTNLDEFLGYDDKKIWWSESLKLRSQRGQVAAFSQTAIRKVLYRPYVSQNLYFDRAFNERVYVFPSIFPTTDSEVENRIICLTGQGSEKPFMTLVSDKIVDLHLVSPRVQHAMLSLLHVQRRRHQSPREHYRLGAGTIPLALQRQVDHQVGHLSVRLRPATSSALSRALRGELETRTAAYSFRS
jgi:predicted helicase